MGLKKAPRVQGEVPAVKGEKRAKGKYVRMVKYQETLIVPGTIGGAISLGCIGLLSKVVNDSYVGPRLQLIFSGFCFLT